MSLKAGYIGVKKSMLGIINSLSVAKIIKTIGNGLKLSNAGSLAADLDNDTMEFKNGKIAAKAVAVNYSTTEKLLPEKWLNGESLYRKVFTFDTTQTIPSNGAVLISEGYSDIDMIISGQSFGSVESSPVLTSIQSGGIKLYADPATDSDGVILVYTKEEV